MTLFMDVAKMRRKTLSRTIIWPHNVIIFSQELSASTHFLV